MLFNSFYLILKHSLITTCPKLYTIKKYPTNNLSFLYIYFNQLFFHKILILHTNCNNTMPSFFSILLIYSSNSLYNFCYIFLIPVSKINYILCTYNFSIYSSIIFLNLFILYYIYTFNTNYISQFIFQ